MMTRPLQTSNPTTVAIDKVIKAHREAIVSEWLQWIDKRLGAASVIHKPTIKRQLALLVDVLALMAGPLRREANNLWFNVGELYGRTAATRGLATGEVVEELQYLRELLIRALADSLAHLPARQLMATVLRLNRALDKGIADAVVGYTDALMVTLFSQRGVPVPVADAEENETAKQLDVLEAELKSLTARS